MTNLNPDKPELIIMFSTFMDLSCKPAGVLAPGSVLSIIFCPKTQVNKN
jgi:hypothetical protein